MVGKRKIVNIWIDIQPGAKNGISGLLKFHIPAVALSW